MLNPKEEETQAAQREFSEEALGRETCPPSLQALWASGQQVVYRGVMVDPKNTDNAWKETVVLNYHDKTEATKGLELKVG